VTTYTMPVSKKSAAIPMMPVITVKNNYGKGTPQMRN
jgi:hypothetical protein